MGGTEIQEKRNLAFQNLAYQSSNLEAHLELLNLKIVAKTRKASFTKDP